MARVPDSAWVIGAMVFMGVVGGLEGYWTRSSRQLEATVRLMFPTPPEQINVRI